MTEEARKALRRKCLQSLASIMLQVNAIRHNKAGSPIYNEAGNFDGVGSFRIPNPAEYDGYLAADFSAVAMTEQNKSYCEIGASDNEQAYLLSMLDRHPKMEDNYGFNQGAHKLLRMFIDWGSTKHTDNDFVLAHPDLDLQNILIDKYGNVTGLVDWDGVTMVPRSIGCSFPKWLSRDWDPNAYRWYSCKSSSDPSQLDHSPDEMNYYRDMYTQCFEAALVSGDIEQSETCYVNTVRQSLLFDTLHRAATRPRSFYWSVTKISDLIGHLTSQASFKSAAGCVVGEAPERPSIEDNYTGSESKKDTVHNGTRPDSEGSDKDSNVMLNKNITNDSASTTGSDSEISSENSKSSCATNLTSECASIEDAQLVELCTSRPAPVMSGVISGQISKLTVIEEASREDMKTASLAQIDRFSSPDPVVPASETLVDMRLCSKSPKKLRKLYKSLQLILGKQKKIKPIYQGSDSSEAVSVVVDDTLFELMSKENSCPATEAIDDIFLATGSKTQEIDSAKVQSSTAEIHVFSSADDDYKLRESSQSQLKSDRPEVTHINRPVADQTPQEDIQGTPQSRDSKSETSQNEITTSSEENSSPDSTDPLIRRKGKVGLARRMAHMLVSTCETSDTNSDESMVPFTEIEKSYIQTTDSSKTKRVKRWLKDTFHKGRTSDASSATSASSTSCTRTSMKPPHISKMSSISALGNPFQPENEMTNSTNVSGTKKGPPGQYRIAPSGAKAWDLQNLEPVDEDILRKEEFMTSQIFQSLAAETLDEARMQRLKTGFFALLDSL